MGSALNQLGDEPAAKADSKDDAKVGLYRISLMKSLGAAVFRTDRTGAVGRALSRGPAAWPSCSRAVGLVGRAVMPT